MLVRQRAEESGFEHAEHSGVGTDAEREDEDHAEGEAGSAAELADGVAEVLKDGVHSWCPYSARSASMGLTEAARLTGTIAATRTTAVMSRTAQTRATGSVSETPKS